MSAQLDYKIYQDESYAGSIYSNSICDISSFATEGISGIEFARPVSRGTEPKQCKSFGGADFLGISVRSVDKESYNKNGDLKYAQFDTAAIMRKGYIWVNCPAGCDPGDKVKILASGMFDSGNAGGGQFQLVDAQWNSKAGVNELAVIRLDSLLLTAGS